MAYKIEVANLTKTFPLGSTELLALSDVSFRVDDNEFVSIVGASGCGKSTLLSIIGGLLSFDSGSILLEGREILGPGLDRGIVFQNYTLFPWLTAQQNVEFALREAGRNAEQARQQATAALEQVGLARFMSSYPNQLSGGMKQRVAIARALSYHPKMLLMDEPFGALDALTRFQMQELLTSIWEQHRLTVIFVTHDVSEAVFLSDRILVMSPYPGRISREFVVDLPRPRTANTMTDALFREIEAEVLDSVKRFAVTADS